MSIFLSLVGIVGSFFLIKYREKVGDMVGEADWMTKVGGVYNVMIFVAVFIFFWSIATLTGTTSVLFSFLRFLPGLPKAEQPDMMM
jgi:hypothetical protein